MVTRWREIFSVGAITSATPLITTSPRWLVAWHSSVTRCFSGSFSVTLTVTVMVSPSPTGLRNRSDWPR